MANIFDYLSWRGDLDFKTSPFNPVDNIIFSQLSYLTFDGIVPPPEEKCGISIELALKIYNEKLNSPEKMQTTSFFKEDADLIRVMGLSRRFGNCQLFGFTRKHDITKELQFAAVCIYTDDGYCFIAFRGTDSSLVGWKEDFNMCFKDTIPSQIEAVNYLEKIAPLINGQLRIGGHSKGGNLAIYAASQCNKTIQKRITEIYSNDSPGFNEKIISSEGYSAIKNRIHSFVPQSSVIGMLFKHQNEHNVIKSSGSGILQHNLYTWEVTHNNLVLSEKSTLSSQFINRTLREWLLNFDNEHREEFIEAFYHIINAADVKTLTELEKSWFTAAGKVIKSLGNADESKRKLIRSTLKELFRCAARNFETFIKQKIDE